ncbi:MAG: GGDEF domain-containing protein [Xanthomonadales bacterium]|nr:GGDEF domain-containing protein [Xanthomonadales bacterium]
MTPLFSDDSPANQLDPDVIRMYRRVALSIAWVTLVISLFNLLGWLIDSSLVAGIFLGLPPMRAITTSAFLIVALALLGAARTTPRRLPLGLYAGLALIGLGLASLAEHHGWFDFGFSRWTLSTANGPIEASMPWITSLVFMLFGMRILAFCRIPSLVLGDLLAILLLSTSMIALATLGANVGTANGRDLIHATPVAAFLLFANSVAWIAIKPDTPLGRVSVAQGAGGIMARRLLLPALLLPLFYAWMIQLARTHLGIDEDLLIALNAFVIGGSVALLVWYVATLLDRSELQQAQMQQLVSAAHTDPLTGLANRRSFDEVLTRLLQRRGEQDRNFCLLMLDLDKFKSYNDSFGHSAGDEVLRQVGRLLLRGLRPDDLAVRYGGEEFAVLLVDCTEATAMQTAERIRASFLASVWPHRAVTVSIGLTVVQSTDTAASLVERADAALYAAKQQGRNRVVPASALAGIPKPAR